MTGRDEMLDQLAITATFDDLPAAIAARYGGLVTSVNLVFGPPTRNHRSASAACSAASAT